MRANKGKFLLRLLIVITAIATMTYFTEIWLGNITLAHDAGLTFIDDIFIILSFIALILLWVKSK